MESSSYEALGGGDRVVEAAKPTRVMTLGPAVAAAWSERWVWTLGVEGTPNVYIRRSMV